jgi:hypothetical protein
MNNYTVKLSRDAASQKAGHAILSTTVFPAGAPRHLHLQDGVIVANPARVVVLVQLLRKQVVQAHLLRLSEEERGEKTAQLYAFVTSDRCAQWFERMDTSVASIFELETKEKSQHTTVWKRRDELVRNLQKLYSEFWSEVQQITGTAA